MGGRLDAIRGQRVQSCHVADDFSELASEPLGFLIRQTETRKLRDVPNLVGTDRMTQVITRTQLNQD